MRSALFFGRGPPRIYRGSLRMDCKAELIASTAAAAELPDWDTKLPGLVGEIVLDAIAGEDQDADRQHVEHRVVALEDAPPLPNFQTGMPSFLALSARLSWMPVPGKTMTPIGSTSSICVVALERRRLGVLGPVGLEGDLRHLAVVGPFGGDAVRRPSVIRRAAAPCRDAWRGPCRACPRSGDDR